VVLIDGVQGGFFLRKKPLTLVLPVYSNSETAIVGRPRHISSWDCLYRLSWIAVSAQTGRTNARRNPAPSTSGRGMFVYSGFPLPCSYPRTETPEKESTARPRTGWPKKRAGSKWLSTSKFSICERVAWSLGPETMR